MGMHMLEAEVELSQTWIGLTSPGPDVIIAWQASMARAQREELKLAARRSAVQRELFEVSVLTRSPDHSITRL